MCNRNATATWSGFSHQCQVGILVSLRHLRSIPESDYDQYFLEYETREDVAIYKFNANGVKEYISVHQVKAYYSQNSNHKSKYTNVLSGIFETCGNDYLHTVLDIIDWEPAANNNSNNIKRYQYANNVFHCNTTDIENYIKTELKLLLDQNLGQVDLALKQLNYLIDNKIRLEHKKRHKHLFDINFNLLELFKTLNNNQPIFKDSIYNSRKEFYSLFVERFENTDIDDEYLDYLTKSIIDPLYSLDDADFFNFLINLNLDEKIDRLNLPHYNYNSTGFRYVFFNILLDNLLKKPALDANNSVLYKVEGVPINYILTTIIGEEEDSSTIVENLMKNIDSQNLLWDNHKLINRYITKKFHDANPNIMNFDSDVSQFDKFMNFSKNNGLISRDDAKIILRNE
jgi:hypothetical protein